MIDKLSNETVWFLIESILYFSIVLVVAAFVIHKIGWIVMDIDHKMQKQWREPQYEDGEYQVIENDNFVSRRGNVFRGFRKVNWWGR